MDSVIESSPQISTSTSTSIANAPLEDDPDLQRRTLRKLDWILLPFLSVLFCLNSLDRTNVGSAESAHFTRDAGLAPNDLNTSVALFYGFFVVLQPFGAALGRKFGMGRYVPSVMALWGVCTTLHIWVKQRWQLLLLRSIIGILEAGFYPTTVSYLSLFYTRYEFGRRLGLFYGQYAVAGAIGGILAFIVFSIFPDNKEEEKSSMDSSAWKPWQILFLIEGLLTVAVAVLGLVWLPRSATTAWFLSPQERIYAEERVQRDRNSINDDVNPISKSTSESSEGLATDDPNDPFENADSSEDQTVHLLQDHDISHADHLDTTNTSPSMPQSLTADAGLSLSDLLSTILSAPLLLYLLLINILSALPSTAFSVFLPLILSSKHMSSTPEYINLLTAPPFLLAAVTLLLFTSYSDRHHVRLSPILAGLGLSIIGLLLILLLPPSLGPIPAYIALCILLSGSFIASPLTVAWLSTNIPEPGKRAIVLGVNGWGNLAGVLSSLLFSPRFRASGYRLPLGVTLVAVAGAMGGFAGLRIWLGRENRRRGRVVGGWNEIEISRERKHGIIGRRDTAKGEERERMGWWEGWVRRYVGGRVLKMDEEEVFVRRGEEKMTFRFGL